MKIYAIGGYSEIGRNMTAIEVDGEMVILDMGVWMEKLQLHQQTEENVMKLDANELINLEILPDDRFFFEKHGKKVKGIIISHAHLDHLGGLIKLAPKYGCKVLMTPFTAEVANNLMRDQGVIPNRIIRLNPGAKYSLTQNIQVEFIRVTHSTPQTVIVALHTKEGTIVYANDFKFDFHPMLGKTTDLKRLKELGREGVKLLISDSTRIDEERRTFSESLVRDMMSDILKWVEEKAIFFTTFSSHIARINYVIDMANRIGRKVLLLGRSLMNYVDAAERIKLVRIREKAKVVGFANKIQKELKQAQQKKDEYFIICTGTEGEPGSVLWKIANGIFKYKMEKGDQVIFSSIVIPVDVIITQRRMIEDYLRIKGARIFKDIHVSGHAAREDHRDLIKMLNPEYYIPTHGGIRKLASAIDLAKELGYSYGKDTFILQNGQSLSI